MKELYKDIYSWVKKPDNIELNLNLKRKVLIIFQTLLLELLLGLLFTGLIYLVHAHIVKLQNPLMDEGIFLTIFLVVIVIPIIEELIFRFPLKYKRNYLARLLNFLLRGRLKKRWNPIFKYFLYFMAISFGLIHLTNYDNTEALFFILSPIIIGSQLLGGFLLSYIRIKLGFIWSVIQHGVFNLSLIVLSVIFFHNSDIIRISNETHSISIKSLMFVDKDSSHYSTRYNKDLIYLVEGKNISLYDLIDSLNIEGPKPYDNKWINVNIDSENGITKNELERILKREIKFDE